MELRGGERGTVERALVRHCGRGLPGRREVARADGPDEPTRHEVVEGAQRLVDGCGPVGAVELVQVDVVETEPARLASRAATTLS